MEIVGLKQNHLSIGYKRVALVSCAITAAIAMLGLVGYVPGLRRLGSINPDYIPMAPSTAISFLVLSLIALIYLYQSPAKRAVRLFALSACSFVSIFGLLKCVEYFIGIETSFEQLIVRIPDRLGDIPIGIMSPSTGGGFFLGGLGVLYLVLCRGDGKQIGASDHIAGSLGAVTVIIGGIFVLGYLYGQPFMYGMDGTVPMAITTAVAFVVLGVGIMAIVGPSAGLLRFVSGRSTSARLLRVFVPLIMVMVFAEDFLPDLISRKLGMHDTLVDAMLMMAYVFIAGAVAVGVGLSLGHQLDKAEEKLRNLAKFPSENPNPVLRITKDGKLLYANRAALEVLKSWQTEVSETVPQKWQQVVRKVLETEKSVLEEDQISDRILAFVFSPVVDASYVNLYAYDITDQKETANTLQDKARSLQDILDDLRESEERYKRLVEGSPDIVYSFSDKRGGIYYSSSAERILGYPLQYLYENPYLWNESIHPDDRPTLARTMNEFAEGKNFNIEYRIRDASGNWLWLQDRSIGKRLEGNEVIIEGLATEITERKRMEEELRTEKEFTDMALNSQMDTFFLFEPGTGKALRWNKAFRDISGHTDEEIATLPAPISYYSSSDLERATSFSEQVLTKGPGSIELELICKDGRKVTTEYLVSAIRDTQGIPKYLISIGRDITDRKRAEKSLQKSEQLLINSQRLAHVGGWEWDIQTGEVQWSKEVFRIFGLDSETFHPQIDSIMSRLHPDDQNRHEMLLESLSESDDPISFEARILLPDGQVKNVISTAEVIYDEQEHLAGVLGTVYDVTERKRAENALQEEKAFVVSLLDNLTDGFSVLDISGVHINVNPALCRMTGFAREDLIGTGPPHPYWPPEEVERIGQAFQKTMESEFSDIELTFMRKNGERFPVIVSPSAVVDKDGNISNYFATIKDITDRKQAEKELRQSEEQLRQAQKMEAVGRLAGGVAHDFNNMLGVILGHAEMLLGQMDPGQPLHADLTEIQKAAMRSADLTRQLLAFARKQTVTPKVIDLNETVAGMTKMLQRLIGEDIDLTWIPDDKLWLVKIDPSQLDQILANLCVNARDAIADVGKVTIETSNAVFDEAYCELHKGCIPGEYAMLAVSDNGSGIDSDTLENIFEPFFTTKEVGEGTGLGLAMIYGVVKQNRGFIDIRSEPGLGTTFKIYLPRHRARAAALPDNGPDAPTRRGHETILLLEDEPAILKMTTKILEKEGYKVMATGTPVEAIRLAKEYASSIHLLLSDLVMPEMNGRDLAKHLLSLYPHLKCLFMSGYTSNVIAHHGVLDEDVNFIQKPFMRSDLIAKVREVLERE